MTVSHPVCNFASRYYEILARNKHKATKDAKIITCTSIYGYHFSHCHDNYAKSIHLFPNSYLLIKSCVKPKSKSRKMQDMDENMIIISKLIKINIVLPFQNRQKSQREAVPINPG